MMSNFNPETGEWAIAWPGRVAKHDLVYLSPPLDPTQGIPLGNGDLGALCWCEESRLILQINKCNLFDRAIPDALLAHREQFKIQEKITALRHAGRLVIDFGLPIFDPFYLADFTARLSLADATMRLYALGPLGTVRIRAYISGETNTLWIDVDRQLSEPVSMETTLERFGSRNFGCWYSKISRDPSIGLHGASASADAAGVYIEQTLDQGSFTVGCAALAREGGAPRPEIRHQRAGVIRFPATTRTAFSLMAACTSPMESSSPDAVKKTLGNARIKGDTAAHRAHATEWESFWRRSLIECGDDYLDNLWHLTMYYSNACQRGPQPARFIDGLWSWNRDVQPWLHYFHWNQQTLYWPLHAAGHHDLLKPYLEFRFRALPQAKADARVWHGSDGAFVSDIVDVHGINAFYPDNHTPVAEIAMDFWRHYLFTGDRQFLRERALPYMIAAALFFESRVEKRSDGLYHAKEGTPCEGAVIFRDAASELTVDLALFRAVSTALGEAGSTHPHANAWREIADCMTPLPTVEASPDLIACMEPDWILNWGWFKGDRLRGNRLLAAGYRNDLGKTVIGMAPNLEKPRPMPGIVGLIHLIENSCLDDSPSLPMKHVDIMCEVEYLSVYPSGLLGLKDKGSPIFDAAVNTLKLHAPGHAGYDRIPIAMARLGMGRESWMVIRAIPPRWQFYVNGFGHYNWGMKADRALRFRVNYPLDAADEKEKTRLPYYSWPFRHMGMESMSVLACAMNECLLQSHDGVIRAMPAITADRNARFTLHAQGGFVVSAEAQNGAPLWIFVLSRLGNPLRIHIPWPTGRVYRNGTAAEALQPGLKELHTKAGDKILFVPDQSLVERWQTEAIEYPANQTCKTYSVKATKKEYVSWHGIHIGDEPTAMLGLPRMF